MKTKIFLMITASVMMIFTSCRKELSPLEQSSIDLADDEAVSDAVFEDIFNSVDDATIALDDAMKNGDSKSTLLVIEDACLFGYGRTSVNRDLAKGNNNRLRKRMHRLLR
jgi:hypothetical protein